MHVVIAEKAIGHPLPKGAEVHHHSDTQFVICQSHAYHSLLHARARVFYSGGDPNTEAVCGRCRKLKPLSDFSPKPAAHNVGRLNTCKTCDAADHLKRYHRRREALAS